MPRITLSLLCALALVLSACGSDSDYGDAPVVADEPAGPDEITGTLAEGDNTLSETGEYFDIHEITARDGQWIRSELVSTDFDPYIIIRSPTGEQMDVDDSQQGNTSGTKAILQATESGAFQIVVTSYEPGESGAYTLTYEVLDQRPADADEGQQHNATEEATEFEV